jgi:hypothetical protein
LVDLRRRIKECPAGGEILRGRVTGGVASVTTTTTAQRLKKQEARYGHGLLFDEERMELLETIKRFQRKLAVAKA